MDRGASYRSAIFVHNEARRERSLQAQPAQRPVQGEDRDADPAGVSLYPAEDVHQNYYTTHRYDYNRYYEGSGRDLFAERHWNRKQDKDELRRLLTVLQYTVTQEGLDEPAYHNPYWNNTSRGFTWTW